METKAITNSQLLSYLINFSRCKRHGPVCTLQCNAMQHSTRRTVNKGLALSRQYSEAVLIHDHDLLLWLGCWAEITVQFGLHIHFIAFWRNISMRRTWQHIAAAAAAVLLLHMGLDVLGKHCKLLRASWYGPVTYHLFSGSAH